jgi:hypothetical protein
MRKFISLPIMPSVTVVLNYVSMAVVVLTAQATPLADREHCAMSLLYGLHEDQWQPIEEAVALQEHTLKSKRNSSTTQSQCGLQGLDEIQGSFKRVTVKGSSIGEFKEQVWSWFEDNTPQKGGQPDMETAEGQMFKKYQQNIASDSPWCAWLPEDLKPENDHWIGSEFSARLGLPLIRMTFRFYVLENTDGLQSLSLPFVAKVEEITPVATLWLYPNALAIDYDDKEGLSCRSFPTLSESGMLLLRYVWPKTALSGPDIPNLCAWYALSSDLLDRLEDGSPQAVYCFLIHPEGIELNVTLLQKQLPPPEAAQPIAQSRVEPEEEYVPSIEATIIKGLGLYPRRRMEIEYIIETHGESLRSLDASLGLRYGQMLSHMQTILRAAMADTPTYFAYGPDEADRLTEISNSDFRRQWLEDHNKDEEQQTATIKDLRNIRAIITNDPLLFDWWHEEDRFLRMIDSDPTFHDRIMQYVRELRLIRSR